MPEGDTVHLAARRLHAALAGRRITQSDLRVPRFALADLSGQTISEVVARGKHLLMRTDAGVTLHSHLKMEGEWRVVAPGARVPGPAHEIRAVIETADATAVGLRIAEVAVLPTAEEPSLVGHLGPDPLGPDWDREEAERRMRAEPQERALADVLLDQRVIAGIGNVYKSEICFLRGLWPWTAIGEVRDMRAIAVLTERLFAVNKERAGHVTTGDLRRGRHRYVYGRAGAPCRRCGTRIEVRGRERSDERVTYWCPACQPQPG